jgi:LEA14-like dessication related protein
MGWVLSRTMKLTSLLLCSLLGCCLLLAGCTTTASEVSGITVSVDGFRKYDSSPVQTKAIMILRFTSENTRGIGFSGSTHRVYLNGTLVGTAANHNPIGLPPLESITQDVVIDLVNPAAVKQAKAAAGDNPSRYRVESVLHFTIGEEKTQTKSVYDGTVDLRGLDAAAR